MINLHFYAALAFDEEIIRMLSIFDAWCIFKMAENQLVLPHISEQSL